MKLELQIREALQAVKPSHIELINESDMHRGPPGRESHFKLEIVSDAFSGKSRVARQQLVYSALDFAFKAGLHALSLKTYTREEWEKATAEFQSPACAHKK
jgi:stress-induced morphogen